MRRRVAKMRAWLLRRLNPSHWPATNSTLEKYELLLKEQVYEYFPDGVRMRHRKRLVLRARDNNLSYFTDRYSWTGNGKCELSSLTPNFRIENNRKEEFWDYYDIVFPQPLQKRGVTEFTIQWDLEDSQGTSVPFLSSMVDCRIRKLRLVVILPPQLAPKRCYLMEYENYIAPSPSVVVETEWNPATRSITYEVLKPKRDHKYVIRWYYD